MSLESSAEKTDTCRDLGQTDASSSVQELLRPVNAPIDKELVRR